MADKLFREVYIDNEPFNVTSYFRGVTQDLVSRFGSAEQGQSNLDLLKSETQDSWRGGMFQQKFDDTEKASSITNGYFNKLDGNLYPTPYFSNTSITGTGADMNGNGVVSSVWYQNYVYFAYQRSNPPNTNKNAIGRLTPSGTSVTYNGTSIPAGLETVSAPLRLFAWGTWLLAGSTTAWILDSPTGTWQASGSGFRDFCTFNEKLYGIDNAHNLYQITAVAATSFTHGAAIQQIGGAPGTGGDLYIKMLEFNGALYIAMQSGLWRFDGVSVKPVIDLRKSVHYQNFRHMSVHNGRLYYTIKNKLYKFDGTNIEELQDFTDAYQIVSLATGTDRLWILCRYDTGVPWSDKFGSGSSQYGLSAFCYNGIGFFEYRVLNTNPGVDPLLSPISYFASSIVSFNDNIFIATPDVYLNGSLEERSNGFTFHICDLSKEFRTSSFPTHMIVTSSEIDCNYPSVTKVINGIMTSYGGITAGEADIKAEIQFFNGSEWSEWEEIWNTQNIDATGISYDYLLHEQAYFDTPNLPTAPRAYRKIRVRTTMTLHDDTPTTMPFLTDQTIRYTLQPALRRKWLLEIDIQGVDHRNITTPRNSAGNRETRTASQLRKRIYDAYENKLPILFYDVDSTEIISVDTEPTPDEFTLAGTDFIDVDNHIAIQTDEDGWISREIETATPGSEETVVTFSKAGQRIGVGASAAADSAIEDGNQVRRSHVVYIRDIRNERYIIDENTLNNKHKYSDIPSKMTLEIVEI